MKEQQRYVEAAAHFVAASERSLQAGEVGKIALAQLEFADLALTHGKYDEARQYLEESLAGFERAGQTWGTALALDLRGYLACKEGKFEEADELFRRAYGVALSLSLYPFASNIVAGLALVRARTGEPERAVELLTVVRHHTATERHTLTRRVAPLLDELQAVLDEETFSLAEERGKAQRLEALLPV
jgi:tetratricopeptide (TPR) repeat protein